MSIAARQHEPPAAGTVRGDARRRALWLVNFAWIIGSVWFTAVSGTPQTNCAKAMQASEFQYGLLTALPFIAYLLSIPASVLIEATGQRKSIFLGALYLNRVMWLPIAVLPLWIVWKYPGHEASAMSLFLWMMFIMHTGQAIGAPAWQSWMADIIPDRRRGKFFSLRRRLGLISALPAGLLVGWLLDRYAKGGGPTQMLAWCGGIFIVAAVFGIIDIYVFHYVPDVPRAPHKGIHLLRAMRRPLHDSQFLWCAGFVAMLTFAVAFMGQFVTKYVMERMGGGSVNLVTQTMLIVAPNLAAIFLVGSWGKAADRMGKRPLLALAALGLVPVGAGWCFVSGSNAWLGYLLAMAGIALWQGVDAVNWKLVMGASGSQHDDGGAGGSAYAAVNGLIVNAAGMLGGLSAGLIAQSLEHWQWVTRVKTFTYYDVLFALSAILRLAAVVIFLPRLVEPAARPTGEALRFMTANICNNLVSFVQQPLRWMGIRASSDRR